MSKSTKLSILSIWVGVWITALFLLITSNDLRAWQLIFLAVVSAATLSIIVTWLGWLATPFSIGKPIKAVVVLGLIWTCSAGLAYWRWHPKRAVKIAWQDSELLTDSRKDTIYSGINNFFNYLKDDVGFDLPPHSPAIGIIPGRVPRRTSTWPGADIETTVFIPDELANDPTEAEKLYGAYLFNEALRGSNPPSQITANAESASWVFAYYYVSSFNDRNISSAEYGWQSALWDVREKYTQSFADRLMLTVYQTWRSEELRSFKDFDTLFASRVSYAAFLLGKRNGEVEHILVARHLIHAE